MYVVRGNKAYRTKILFGDSNFDYVEVLDGLKEGEKVILSDIGEKYTRQEIKSKKVRRTYTEEIRRSTESTE